MFSGFHFRIKKERRGGSERCCFWSGTTSFCLNFERLLVKGACWELNVPAAKDVMCSLKLCCPSLTASKYAIMVIRRGLRRKGNLSSSVRSARQRATLARSDDLRSAWVDISQSDSYLKVRKHLPFISECDTGTCVPPFHLAALVFW